MPRLIEALGDGDEYTYRGIIELLGNAYSVESIPLLVTALQDKSPSIRQSSIEALRKIKALESIPLIIKSLKDSDYKVRASAAKMLGEMASIESIPSLIGLLKDNSWNVRLTAANALQSIGDEAIPLLLNVLSTNSEDSPVLQEILQNKNLDHRRSVVFVLGKIGGSSNSSKNKLIDIFRNKNENLYVRWMAAAALLDKVGVSVDYFFKEQNLIQPQNLKSGKCSNDYLSYYEKVNDDLLIYSGQCIYGTLNRSGGGLGALYETLKKLLGRG
ncbi:MAG: HEAT repeat domain-containing protein [Pseudanabaena sp. M165S2SP1A06QC]|nr:HEAT repeat domain-containing protein [Pseudanabaena sp. M165S2SP1A06QC]